jgi:glutamine synthetase
VLREFADALESSKNREETAKELIRDVVKNHSRIIFNGDGYSKEWEKEAEKRGLLNLKSTVDAIPLLESEKNVALFVRNHVFNETEVHSRCEIMLENYSKILHIEALTMLEMVRCSIIPAISDYIGTLSRNIKALRDVCSDAPCVGQLKTVNKLAKLLDEIYVGVNVLDTAVALAEGAENALATAKAYREQVFTAMEALRYSVDSAEALCDARAWPFPKYSELLFGI